MPAEGAVGPSGSRTGGAGGARCSRGVASAGGAHGARGAAAARDDLWGTGVSAGGKDRAPPNPPEEHSPTTPPRLPWMCPPPQGCHIQQVPPAQPTLPLSGNPRNFSQDPRGHSGLRNHPNAAEIPERGGLAGSHVTMRKFCEDPRVGGCQVPRSCFTPSCASPSSDPQSRSHSPIGDPKCGPRGGSPMGGGPGCGIPGGGRGGGCPPEPGGPGWCCPMPGGPWCTCIGGIPRGTVQLGGPGSSSRHSQELKFQLGLESMAAGGLLLPKRGFKEKGTQSSWAKGKGLDGSVWEKRWDSERVQHWDSEESPSLETLDKLPEQSKAALLQLEQPGSLQTSFFPIIPFCPIKKNKTNYSFLLSQGFSLARCNWLCSGPAASVPGMARGGSHKAP